MNITTLSTGHPFGSLTVERLKEAKRLIDGITPGSVFGIRIFWSSLCLEETREPVRVYKRRRRQTAHKAALVQKKWIKRWGYTMRPCIYQTAQGYFAHPSFKAKLEAALAREQIIRESQRPNNFLFAA